MTCAAFTDSVASLSATQGTRTDAVTLSWSAAQPALKAEAQDYEDYSRVILTLPSPLPFTLVKDDNFLQVRIPTTNTFKLKAEPVRSRFIKSFSWNRSSGVFIVAIEGRHGRFRYRVLPSLSGGLSTSTAVW